MQVGVKTPVRADVFTSFEYQIIVQTPVLFDPVKIAPEN